MSWQAIAKKDFQDSVRSRVLWGIIVLFFLAIGGLTYLILDSEGEGALEAVLGGTFFFGILLFIPLTGLFISVKSIVRERESGTINLLLSMPHSRGEMVAGKFLGRSGVLSLAILVGFLPAMIALFIETDAPISDIFVILLTAVLFGIMFVGIGVGFSALVNSETQATVGGIAVFFVLYLWPFILNQILGLVDADLPTFAERFWLLNMFEDMVESLVSDGVGATAGSAVTREFTGTGVVRPDSVAFYMQNWFAFVILALWIAVPLLVGYLQFRRIDL